MSPDGKDNNPGSLARPLKTLQAALQKVASADAGAVSIQLRKGYYPQNQVLTINTSLLAGHRLDIRSYHNERVVVTGSARLSPQWKVWKGKVLSSFIGRQMLVDQLFCDGIALPMARYPNAGAASEVYRGTAPDAISPERVKRWANPAGGYVHALHESLWGSFDYVIRGRDDSGHLQLEGGWQNNRPAPIHQKFRFVENIFEELDSPGEWYYNPDEGILYLYPPKGTDVRTARFERAVLSDIIHLTGDAQDALKGVTIRGIDFSETSRTFMQTKEPLQRSDWTIYRGGAILLEGTEDCHIRDCNFSWLGGNAIFLSGYNRKDTVSGCHIEHIGASALCFVGDSSAVRSPYSSFDNYLSYQQLDLSPGPKSNEYPADCLVADCLINDLGETEKQATGVEIQMAEAITVRHNTIYNTPRAGINIGDGRWGGHVIEYNDVFNTVLETGDHGAFNSWGRDRFWAPDRTYMDSLLAVHPELILLDAQRPVIIRNNRFRCDHGWDIDLDDGSTNYRIYNNVCLNGGLKLREGFYRVVYNNIILNNSFHPHVWFENSHDEFTHNIVMRKHAPIGIRYWGNRVDSNLFSGAAALGEARAAGTDAHSIAGNPGFNRPEAGDYTVEAASQAKEIGFVNFPMNEFGVQKASLKQIALHPSIPSLLWHLEAGKASEAADFKGSLLKKVEGLGERSAYGLPDEQGLIVISVGQGTVLEKSGLKDKDVIRSIDGKPVNSIADMQEGLNKASGQKNVEAGVIRNQKPLQIRLIL